MATKRASSVESSNLTAAESAQVRAELYREALTMHEASGGAPIELQARIGAGTLKVKIGPWFGRANMEKLCVALMEGLDLLRAKHAPMN